MPTLKRILNFYIFSNVHVALAVFCLVKITLLTYQIHSNLIPLFCLFSTIFSYNLIRIFRVEEVQPWFFEFIKTNKSIIILLTVFSGVIAFAMVFKFRYQTILWLFPFAVVTMFYVSPFGTKKRKLSLRYVAFIKLFLIAVSWAGVTVLIPLIQHRISIGLDEIITFIQRFLFVVAITIPFDIRDMSYDKEELKTLPQAIGIQKSIWLGLLFLMLFLGLEFLKSPVQPEQLRIHFFIAFITLLFLAKSTDKQNEYYSAFFVESLPMAWLGLFIWLG
ncbi:hypothetical protein UMM65_16965 [Aureibaculum sp. 2210JD6-5]|uniref:hypothetical protein n=1 Tax=Aureibaculum sp. 2210JD6-5 TaxID=3103957 RepID=UPI002AACAF6F|nr:hypothetical protein [Aureibaculum sp. 2210JD6-5]MDY7396940.1 hypothetical protein [Aureibaculum sp. 2210JD6-5]